MSSTRRSKQKIPQRGDVFSVSFDPARGAEIKKTRPAVIVSNNYMNQVSRTVLVMPVTAGKYRYLVRILLKDKEGGTSKTSVIATDQIRAIDKSRLKRKLGKINQKTLKQVEKAIKSHFDLPDQE